MFHRLYHGSDFAKCVELLHPGCNLPPRQRAELPAIWRRLHLAGQLHGGVVVDPDLPAARSIVAFGMSVFVSEDFVVKYLDSPVPFVSAQIYAAMLADRSPILAPAAVARANAAAELNLVILHFGMRHAVPGDERGRAIAVTAHESFRLTHVGYRIKRVLQEAYGPEQLPFFKAGGFQLKSDFHGCFDGDEPAPYARPFLMGLYREDPESRYPGAGLSYLFQYAQPRFQFAASEQRVLQRALIDESDDVIADTLGVSHDAVKKSWRRIYERVAAAAPDLISDAAGAGEGEGTRGKEKRRRLLQYLRHHLEELRPFKHAPASAHGRSAASASPPARSG